jgi:hypothetical protein
VDRRAGIAPDEARLHGLSIVVLLLAVAGVLPALLGVGVALVTSGLAASRSLRRHRDAVRRRRAADALLAAIPGTRVPDRLRWRAGELTSPAHRRRAAAELRRFARMADQPILHTSVPVHLSTIGPNHDRLQSMATIVERLERPVTPQGMVLLEELLGAGGASPLYRPGHAAELDRALRLVRGAIECGVSQR